MPSISYETWLAALTSHETQATEGAKTALEWAEDLGVCRTTVNAWIRQGLKNRWMRRVNLTRTRIDGLAVAVPGYLVIESDKEA